MRGEEKRNPRGLTDSRRELFEKFGNWSTAFYGQLPFVLGYATGGLSINFFLLTPNKECIAVFPTPFYAGHVDVRMRLVQVVINIFRLFRTMCHLLPSDCPIRLFSTLERQEGVSVTIFPTFVLKKIPLDWKYARKSELLTLYNAILEQKPRNIVNIKEMPTFTRRHMRLELSPVGYPVHVRDIIRLRHTIRDMLKGLAFLHKLGYVHRDLRWANVIRDRYGNVRLIDLEHAGLEGTPDHFLDTWPISGVQDGVYTKSMDNVMLHTMIMTYHSLIQDDEEALNFMAELKTSNSAEETVLHPWLCD